MFFDDLFANGETIRKRDEYKALYDILTEALEKHDRTVGEAESAYNSYISSVPNLSNSEIPSNDFEPKRVEKNNELNKYFNYERDKRSSLAAAKSKAYERYLHYKNLAMKEAEEEKEKLKKEIEEGIKDVKNGLGRWIGG